MSLSQDDLESLVFEQIDGLSRFTQDSPVYPDVWQAYNGRKPEERVELLLIPNVRYTAGDLLMHLRQRLRNTEISRYQGAPELAPWSLASSGSAVLADLTFEELIRAALPLTRWCQTYLWDEKDQPTVHLRWLQRVAGAIAWSQHNLASEEPVETSDRERAWKSAYDGLAEKLDLRPDLPYCLWSVSLNRQACCQVKKSVPATKADAARRLFDVDGSGIRWAVIDSGVDARRLAFRKAEGPGKPYKDAMDKAEARKSNNTRIVATYDFTRLRDLMSNVELQASATDKAAKDSIKNDFLNKLSSRTSDDDDRPLTKQQITGIVRELERALKGGRVLDWAALAPLLRIPHNRNDYEPPPHPHGTHVAGILAADTRLFEEEPPLVGMCPGIELYDLRVMRKDGTGDEFSILAALQFLRWLNAQRDQLVIHGVNLSLSMVHSVANFACGRTPVCEECQRLTGDGVVVVASAGNQGRTVYVDRNNSREEGFRTVSITDPGNADAVITVGATHRFRPHTYGVSYFSSRGPTGDGRLKPDLLAPGEKITSVVPGNDPESDDTKLMDGTSMAAPHVSGAAALLLAQHRELIGQPQRVKDVLCQAATDLGRERYFQGHGMLDTLRALQSL